LNYGARSWGSAKAPPQALRLRLLRRLKIAEIGINPTLFVTITIVTKKLSLVELKEKTRQIIRRLKREYPDAHCSLNHSNAFELLTATILSAQCTDERVNIVTADLFRKYRKPEDYLRVPVTELQEDVRTTGFFRNK